MSSVTKNWLRQNITSYSHPDPVYSHILNLLLIFPTIRPKSDVYTFDDGRTQLLLCVHGLLPISFRNASYNIPIAVWITRDYPKQPPITYVVPTNDMLVKPGKFLDVSGRCNIDYLQHWERKDEGCTLSALFQALQDHFSREPPVYSKPKEPIPYADRPPPPLPSDGPVSTSSPTPPLPTKPSTMIASSISSLQPQRSTNNVLPSSTQSPPPLPPHPPSLRSPGYSPTPTTGPIEAPPKSLPSPQPLRGYISQESIPPPLATNISPPIPPPHSFYSHTTSPAPEPSHIPVPNLLDEDAEALPFPRPNISFQPLPMRPPNPELLRLQEQVHRKLTSELNSLSQSLSLDAEHLRAHQANLLAGEPAIKDEMARLEAVRDVCRNVANRTRQSIQQADSNITELKRKGDPEVDELVCATSIVHNQLINLVADDNAIEDTIYHLHRALNTGRIDLERFLRLTRVLAEEQFMKRALVDKIQMSVGRSPTMTSNWA
ncbi:UEV-domain-containing protein [Phlegmacium glaucopus]|nr:UEV-domain-containing protein [Phlegmacium glaucopus]